MIKKLDQGVVYDIALEDKINTLRKLIGEPTSKIELPIDARYDYDRFPSRPVYV